MNWRLHWLEAESTLDPWRERIIAELKAAHQAVAGLVEVPAIDVLLQRLPGKGIPEIGMVGRAYRARLFALTLDPDNARFAASLDDGALRRTIAHEVHHCLRMAGPGYGRTLGEVLVSEGLAGQFTRQLFANPPEPWECAVDEAALQTHCPSAHALTAPGYDHAAWFFGTRQRPRWLGYTLGYRIVEAWLAGAEPLDGDTWVNVTAATVLSALGRLGVDPFGRRRPSLIVPGTEGL